MNHVEGLATMGALLPLTIGGALCLLALMGIRELLKEAAVAIK